MEGQIKFYNDEKGFGFIEPIEGTMDLFFHITQAAEGYDPQDGDLVTYEIGTGRDGRPTATDVVFTDEIMGSEEEQEEEIKEEPEAVKQHKAALLSSTNERLVEEVIKYPELLASISSRAFEILVAKILEDMGYRVSYSPEDEAGARYIIALSLLPNGDEIRTVVACKKNDGIKKVTAQVIERVLWVTEKKDYAPKAMIVTSTSFSMEALKYEREYSRKLSLKDNRDLKDWLKAYGQKNEPGEIIIPQIKKNLNASSKRAFLDKLIYNDDLENCVKEFSKLAVEYSLIDEKLLDVVFLFAGTLALIEKSFKEDRIIDFQTYLAERNRLRSGIANLRHRVYKLPFE